MPPSPNGPFRTVHRSRLVDQVADQLRELIISGKLEPGERLHQVRLSEELGVSRTPLREAFRILERDGLITPLETNRTLEVAKFSDDDVRHLYEVREFIDGLAARLAARARPPAQVLAQLDDLSRQLVSKLEPFDLGKWLKTHVAFHLLVLKASGNPRVEQLDWIVRISGQMLYPRLPDNRLRMEDSAREHAEISRAIRSGDLDEAEDVARRHIQSALASWQPELASDA